MLGSSWVYWLRTWILEPNCLAQVPAQVPAQPLPSYVTSDNTAGPQPPDLCNGNKTSHYLVGLSRGLDELAHVRHLEQLLAHSQELVYKSSDGRESNESVVGRGMG